MCHSCIRNQLRSIDKYKYIVELCEEFNLDLTKLSFKSIEKVICLKRKMVRKHKEQDERKRKILMKLLNEYKRQREIDEEQTKTYDYRVKKKEKIIKGMIVEGLTMTLVSGC